MKAIVIKEFGGPEVLKLEDVEEPRCGLEDIVVRVRATALNRADLLQRRGKYPPPPGVREDIPGLEFAGEVESVGERVTLWKAGDRVMGLLSGEGYAEKIVTHERMALAVPSGMPFETAASIPEAYLTAFDAVMLQMNLKMGEKLLIHAVASGVGLAAKQLAECAGAFVIGTTRSEEKVHRLKESGIDLCIDTSKEDFQEVVRRECGGVDAILDLVGASYFQKNLATLSKKGRMIIVGLVGGLRTEVDLSVILGKRLSITGTVLRNRPLEEKIALTQEFRKQVLPLFGRNKLALTVGERFPLVDAAKAHALMEKNANVGKIVLTV